MRCDRRGVSLGTRYALGGCRRQGSMRSFPRPMGEPKGTCRLLSPIIKGEPVVVYSLLGCSMWVNGA